MGTFQIAKSMDFFTFTENHGHKAEPPRQSTRLCCTPPVEGVRRAMVKGDERWWKIMVVWVWVSYSYDGLKKQYNIFMSIRVLSNTNPSGLRASNLLQGVMVKTWYDGWFKQQSWLYSRKIMNVKPIIRCMGFGNPCHNGNPCRGHYISLWMVAWPSPHMGKWPSLYARSTSCWLSFDAACGCSGPIFQHIHPPWASINYTGIDPR